MPSVEQAVDVNVSVRAAYDQWARFESFPGWMEGVVSVERIDDGRLHWVALVRNEFATVEGETREWEARITGQDRDRRISWESIAGPGEKPNTGEVSFEPRGESSCRVTFSIGWEPEAGMETPDELLSAMHQVMAADLGRFRDLIETAD
ncbi:MAG TPA: SRPBCC family protein [Thermoleophilia bacterium]